MKGRLNLYTKGHVEDTREPDPNWVEATSNLLAWPYSSACSIVSWLQPTHAKDPFSKYEEECELDGFLYPDSDTRTHLREYLDEAIENAPSFPTGDQLPHCDIQFDERHQEMCVGNWPLGYATLFKYNPFRRARRPTFNHILYPSIALTVGCTAIMVDYWLNGLVYSPLYEQQLLYAEHMKKTFRTFTTTPAVLPNTQSTTHPIAAGFRAHNRKQILDFAQTLGRPLYEIHSGYHNNIPHYQNVYGPSDLTKRTTFDLVYDKWGNSLTAHYTADPQFHQAEVIILIESDFYVNLPELLSYRKPVIILTKDTKTLCANHGEMHHCPTGSDLFEYNVLGGAIYKHKSHRYDHDHIVVEYDNNTTACDRQHVYNVDRFPLENGDLAVFLTPLPAVPAKFPLTEIYQHTTYTSENHTVHLQLVYHNSTLQPKYTLYIAYPYSDRSFSIEWDTALTLDNADSVAKLTTAGAAALLIKNGEVDHDKVKFLRDIIITNKELIWYHKIITGHRHTGELPKHYKTRPGYTLRRPTDHPENVNYDRTKLADLHQNLNKHIDHRINQVSETANNLVSNIGHAIDIALWPVNTLAGMFFNMTPQTARTVNTQNPPTPPANPPAAVNTLPPPVHNDMTTNKSARTITKTADKNIHYNMMTPEDVEILSSLGYFDDAKKENAPKTKTIVTTNHTPSDTDQQNNKITSDNTQPILLLPSHMDLDPTPEDEIEKNHKFEQLNAQFKFKNTLRAINNMNYKQLLKPVHTKDFKPDHGLNLDDDDNKPLMRQIFPPIYDPDSNIHLYTKSDDGSFDAIFQRIQNVNTFEDNDMTTLSPIFETIQHVYQIAYGQHKISPLDVEDIEEYMTTANQKKRYNDYKIDTTYTSDIDVHSHNNAFIKAELADKEYGAQRNISNVNTTLFIQMSRYIIPAAEHFKTHTQGYVFQYNSDMVGKLVHSRVQFSTYAMASDFSKFDGTQNQGTKFIEKLYHLVLFKSANELFDLIDEATKSTFRASADMKYSPNYTRLSGSAETSFGNSLVNHTLGVVSYLYSKSGSPYSVAIKPSKAEIDDAFSHVIIGGDDGIMLDNDQTRYEELVKLFKMKITIEAKPSHEPLNMLSLIYPNAKVSPCAGPDFNRILPKLCYGVISTPLNEVEQISAKLMGYMSVFTHNNPKIDKLFDKLVILLEPYLVKTKLEPRDLPFTHYMGQPLPIVPELLDVYYQHITPGTQRMLDLIDEAKDLEELVELSNNMHSMDDHPPITVSPEVKRKAKAYLYKLPVTTYENLSPELQGMMPKNTTITAIINLLKHLPTPLNVYDATVGSGSILQSIVDNYPPKRIKKKLVPQIHTLASYFDQEEHDNFLSYQDHFPILDTAQSKRHTRPNGHTWTIIIDLPFDMFKEKDNNGDNLGIETIINILMNFDVYLKDHIILNLPRNITAQVISTLAPAGIKLSMYYASRNSAILTNIVDTPPDKHKRVHYDLTNNKSDLKKNLQDNLKLTPNMPLTKQEANLLSTEDNKVPHAPPKEILKKRGRFLSNTGPKIR